MANDSNLRVTIDEWSPDGKTFIKYHARLESEVVGMVAFEALMKENRHVRLRLCNGARIMRDHQAEPFIPNR